MTYQHRFPQRYTGLLAMLAGFGNVFLAATVASLWLGPSIPVARANDMRHALDNKPIAECLAGLDLQWRLPYYPQLTLFNCTVDKPPASSVANTLKRRVTAVFGYSTEAFPRATDRPLSYAVGPVALYTHFDRLLTSQGFARVEGPLVNAQMPAAAYPESAAYERRRDDGMDRVEFSIEINNTMALVLETYGPMREAAKLPSPQADFDITEAGVHGRLFAISGAPLVSEQLVWEQHNFSENGSLADQDHSRSSPVFVPVRQFRYRFEGKVSAKDALSAWQRALRQAGWEAAAIHNNALRYSEKLLLFKLPVRTLQLRLSTFSDNGTAELTAILADPGLWPSIVPTLRKLRSLQRAQSWEIAPEFDAGGKPTVATRLKLFALGSQTGIEKDATLLVVPVVEPSQANNKAAVEQAQKAARWVRDELAGGGILGNGGHQSMAVDIYPDAKPPLLPKFEVAVGARVAYRWCNTELESRPDQAIKRCVCKADGEVLSTRDGECRP